MERDFFMQYANVIEHITQWLKSYADRSGVKGFVVGISGGIDSAVTSALCARTGKKVICVNMPIHQRSAEKDRGHEHINWLKSNYETVSGVEVNLTDTFESLRNVLPENAADHFLAMANSRARLRMTTLYAIGQANGLLVAGTGNKVEDFGVGFFTKYGDGGVDLSPIADLTKTDVFRIGKELGIVESIMSAKPTDGLWEDGRSDEDQLGASYPDLEWAMNFVAQHGNTAETPVTITAEKVKDLNQHHRNIIEIYLKFHNANKHKMLPIPVCEIPENLKN